jgi:hypothetical protein
MGKMLWTATAVGLALGGAGGSALAQDQGWYTQGDFIPTDRVEIVIANDLNEDRKDAPIVIRRDQLPMLADIQELTATVVDPAGAPDAEPSAAVLARQGPTSGAAKPTAMPSSISSTTSTRTESGTSSFSSPT